MTGAELAQIDAWWRASNRLTIGQIYLAGPGHGGPISPSHVSVTTPGSIHESGE